jgi:hypothetical protein
MDTHKMVIRADARAMGAVTDHDVRVTPRWQGSSATQRAEAGVGTSECVSYYRDENGEIINARIFKPKRERTATRSRQHKNDRNAQRLALLHSAGIIGDVGN